MQQKKALSFEANHKTFDWATIFAMAKKSNSRNRQSRREFLPLIFYENVKIPRNIKIRIFTLHKALLLRNSEEDEWHTERERENVEKTHAICFCEHIYTIGEFRKFFCEFMKFRIFSLCGMFRLINNDNVRSSITQNKTQKWQMGNNQMLLIFDYPIILYGCEQWMGEIGLNNGSLLNSKTGTQSSSSIEIDINVEWEKNTISYYGECLWVLGREAANAIAIQQTHMFDVYACMASFDAVSKKILS